MTDEPDPDLGSLLELVVHDLKNPLAAVSANLGYVRTVSPSADVVEAVTESEAALAQLGRGLEQLGWIAHWIGSGAAAAGIRADARESVRRGVDAARVEVAVELPDGPVECDAGPPLERLVRFLVECAAPHAQSIAVRLTAEGVLEVIDDGPAVPEELRAKLFTMTGQADVKRDRRGRYVRCVGLFAAGLLAQALGASLEAGGEDGAAIVRVRLAMGPTRP